MQIRKVKSAHLTRHVLSPCFPPQCVCIVSYLGCVYTHHISAAMLWMWCSASVDHQRCGLSIRVTEIAPINGSYVIKRAAIDSELSHTYTCVAVNRRIVTRGRKVLFNRNVWKNWASAFLFVLRKPTIRNEVRRSQLFINIGNNTCSVAFSCIGTIPHAHNRS